MIIRKSFHNNPSEWDGAEAFLDPADWLPEAIGGGSIVDTHRPYFEVLIVSSAPPAKWASVAREMRRQRHHQAM